MRGQGDPIWDDERECLEYDGRLTQWTSDEDTAKGQVSIYILLIKNSFIRRRKSSAGPDLGRLYIGSEGTLGIITEATLKLVPVLPYSVGVSSFPSVELAADCVRDVVQQGIMVQCIELLDDVSDISRV